MQTSRSGSVIPAPRYSTPGDRNDEFLLGLIGVLETLADTSKNFEKSLKTLGLDGGVPPKDFDSYVAKAEEICGRLGVKVSRGRGTYNAGQCSSNFGTKDVVLKILMIRLRVYCFEAGSPNPARPTLGSPRRDQREETGLHFLLCEG